MELLNGRDLSAELESRGPLPVNEAVDYLLQTASGLAELHALGVVHRDLKPSNLFLAEIAGVPTVKILDFGISKEMSTSSTSLTTTENLLGTPGYMSPEQIKASKDVDVRADVWSLGVILYELLTAKMPFDTKGDSIGELFAVILMTPPVPLRERRPELSAELEAAVMKCLRQKPEERYANVGEFASALKPFVRGGSVHRIEAIRRALGDSEWVEKEEARKDHSERALTHTERPPSENPKQDPSIGDFIPQSAQIPMATSVKATAASPHPSPPQRRDAASSRSLATSVRPVIGDELVKPFHRTPLFMAAAALVTIAIVLGAFRYVEANRASDVEPTTDSKSTATAGRPEVLTAAPDPSSTAVAPLGLPTRADPPADSVNVVPLPSASASAKKPGTHTNAIQQATPHANAQPNKAAPRTEDLIEDRK
jgi:serine/threonine protein kinase